MTERIQTSWHDLIGFLRSMSKRRLTAAEADGLAAFMRTRVIPWPALLAQAQREGVAGLIYTHLKNRLADDLPHEIFNRFEAGYNRTALDVQRVLAAVHRLALRLDAAGIPVMALQGLSLIDLYGHVGLRPLGDVDLLVRRRHLAHFKRLLFESGFTIPVPEYPDVFYGNGFWLDIHTHILGRNRIRNRRFLFSADLEPMWQKAEPLFQDAQLLCCPSPVDNLMALAAHALKHSYSRLIWMVDQYELFLSLTERAAEWNRIFAAACSWRQGRVFGYSLYLLRGMFGLTVSASRMLANGLPRLNTFEKHILRLKVDGFASDLICPALWLFNVEGTKRKMALLRETLFPQQEVMAQIKRDNGWFSGGQTRWRRLGSALSILGRDIRKAAHFTARRLV